MAATQDPLKIQVFKSVKRSHDMFLSEYGKPAPLELESQALKVRVKIQDEYERVKDAAAREAPARAAPANDAAAAGPPKAPSEVADMEVDKRRAGAGATAATAPAKDKGESTVAAIIDSMPSKLQTAKAGVVALVGAGGTVAASGQGAGAKGESSAMMPRAGPVVPKPQWHAPWKLYRVIAGHTGWVRCLAFDPTNQWFATGSNDRTIKIWDLASGTLKLSLTGHVSHVRALAVSNRHPYLFSAGEDKQVKCWDLECNKVIRHYHGHLSAVYTLSIHPTLDLIVTGARDSTARVWDMRTKACVHVLGGHTDAVSTVLTQGVNPQVTTTSYDSTVRLWDLAAGKSITTLTNHKKAVRAGVMHPTEFSFATGSADNIKKWKYPRGDFMMNMDTHKSVINSMAANQENVLVSAGDNGTLQFYDWKTGYNFQQFKAPPQPGSLESESGVFAIGFDMSGSRLVTCEADKSIKMYKEDDTATEETHPVVWRPDLRRKKF